MVLIKFCRYVAMLRYSDFWILPAVKLPFGFGAELTVVTDIGFKLLLLIFVVPVTSNCRSWGILTDWLPMVTLVGKT